MLERDQQHFQAFLISLLVHACLVLLALLLPKLDLGRPTNQPIEIVYQNETSKPRQHVIDTNDNFDEELKNLKDQVNRLSKVTRRVVKEQRAAKVGETQNRSGQDGQATQKHLARTVHEDLKGQGEERPSITAPMPGSSVAHEAQIGDSTISDYIPEVKVGGFTSLNQDQFLFYTFFARINEQIRNHWIENVRSVLGTSPQSQLSKWAEKTQITAFEVLVTAEGKYVRTIIYRQSESQQLDKAAIAALRLASPYNNPPSELVEADGYIHLRYQFHVELRPSLIASGARSYQ